MRVSVLTSGWGSALSAAVRCRGTEKPYIETWKQLDAATSVSSLVSPSGRHSNVLRLKRFSGSR